MKKILALGLLLVGVQLHAQYQYRDGNRIGISAGITQMTLLSSNFKVKPEMGFAGGLSVRGNFYNDFSMTYGMQFINNSFSLESTNATSFKKEDVKYTVSGVQIRLLLSYNIVEDYFAVDFGPVLQVNGKLKVDKGDNTISGTLLKAEDIVDVTTVNGNLYFGITTGSKTVKAIIFYQYGVNNFMNKLNKDDELKTLNNGDQFKGNIGLIGGQLLVSL
ncbi:outer membrane beta-barrel protein [Flavobacterium sp. CYK-4]|uniref:outer membrane beta-barrel protein n=1 Tax=Flavobacterium lotistagni TaxID=2709660 RepID=UPI00140BBD2A|nr:outer membrane beta-barrel protein [Flavobacterium lotistagni]NHM06122.1 outer membrane beta-barrel protein [Flavobacterium lotistagni]